MRDYNPVYSVLYLDLWDRKCCFVICIVIVNAILVVQRRIDRSATGGFNFSNSTRKHLCQSVFFKRLCCRFFPVNFPKFVRPLFLQNPFGRLLLYLEPYLWQNFLWKYRSSRPEVFFKKVLLEISQNSQENTCALGLRPATLLKKRL